MFLIPVLLQIFLFLLVRVPSAHVPPCGEMRGRKSGLSASIICVPVLSLVRQFYEASAVVFFVATEERRNILKSISRARQHSKERHRFFRCVWDAIISKNEEKTGRFQSVLRSWQDKLWRQISRTGEDAAETTRREGNKRDAMASLETSQCGVRFEWELSQIFDPISGEERGASLHDAWRMRCGVARAKNGKLHARAGRPRPAGATCIFVDDVSTLPRENTLYVGYIVKQNSTPQDK